MVIQCPKCKTKKKIKINEELRGKKISFLCKTTGCNEKISTIIPSKTQSPQARKTIILNTKSDHSVASIILMDENGNTPKIYKIKKGINIVGRIANKTLADIAIESDDRYMSRTHCTITTSSIGENTQYIIKDYQSKNDTFINGLLLKKEEEIYLQNDDILQLGKTKLKFQIT